MGEDGEPTDIRSKCEEGRGNLDKTFVYKEVAGDFRLHVRLNGFDRTSTDKEYFSLLATDKLDFEVANFFELRHFSNNNNILLVSHGENEELSTTSYWAGDMNNKDVPIDFIIERDGDVIEYWYSLDGGVTYEQTSKAVNTIPADSVMYVGAAMTCQSGEMNTAHFEDLTIEGSLVGAPVKIGDTVEIDFTATDPDNDALTYDYNIPDGAAIENNIVKFTPVYGGAFTFMAAVNDAYHTDPVYKTIRVRVEDGIDITIDGIILETDVPAYISNGRVLVPIRAISERLGADVSWDEASGTAVIEKDGTSIELVRGSGTAMINGVSTELEEPAVITQGRFMVPIRFVAEALSCDVNWDEENSVVMIER